MLNGTWNLLRRGSRERSADETTRAKPSAAPSKRVRARVLCVASGKGGTGKSILAANLAVLRAQSGERVLLVDFDAGMANAHLLLGIQPRFDLGNVLDGDVSASYAATPGPNGLHLIAGGVGRAALLNPTPRELEKLFAALAPLEEQFDLIVVDHGAGLSFATLAHLAAASTLLLVTTHEVTALSDAYALYKQATIVNPTVKVGAVLNRAPDQETALAAWGRFQGAAQKFLSKTPELVGWIPHDDSISRSVQARRPVVLREPKSQAGEAIARIARWPAIDEAATERSFYDAARRALRG